MLTAEHEKTITMITQALAQAPDQASRQRYQAMLLEQVRQATKSDKEEKKSSFIGISPTFIPSFNVQDLTKQFESNSLILEKPLSLQSLNHEIKEMKKQVSHLYNLDLTTTFIPSSFYLPSYSTFFLFSRITSMEIHSTYSSLSEIPYTFQITFSRKRY